MCWHIVGPFARVPVRKAFWHYFVEHHLHIVSHVRIPALIECETRRCVHYLDMAEADSELRELWHLLEDLLSDKVHAPVLRPQVQLSLKPRGSDLNSSVRGHV